MTSSLKLDARAERRTVLACGLGTMLEQFDFAIYGLAAALVFPSVFFPESSPLAGALMAFAGYAVGFLARPVGGIFFSHFGEKHGRKWVLVSTLFLMGGATFLIGCLPGHQTIGLLAPILLFTLRLAQGFGAGAEQAGGATLLTESAHIGKRGRRASVVMIGAAAGTVIGTLFFAVIQWFMPKHMFIDWGWRIVFWLSILITFAAWIIRQKMSESPVFQQMQKNTEVNKATSAPLSTAVKSGWKRILLVAAMNWGPNTQSYTVQTFFVTFVTAHVLVPGTSDFVDKSTITDIQLIGALVGMVSAYFWGRMSDHFGRKPIYILIAASGIFLPFIYFTALSSGTVFFMAFAVCLGYWFAAYGNVGVQMAYFPELFGTRYRYTGVTLARELSSVLGGGIAPMISSALLLAFDMWWPVALYMAFTMMCTTIASFYAPETLDRDLTMLHDAVDGEAHTAKEHLIA
ncbi:MFS transporter [Arcanobacterium canis]|uniref:MFS transporter n=1 Tax=Arcanobacterium canis TaxID=999183 RepID=A0ABY8FYA6_9ACTO|nr:MFS transporter [Arcanobacterium canis]WFM83482.1 MFS transporter [Arcanobacterium canis]